MNQQQTSLQTLRLISLAPTFSRLLGLGLLLRVTRA